VATPAAVLQANQLSVRSGDDTLLVRLENLIALLGATPAAHEFLELPPDRARLDVVDTGCRRRGTFIVFLVQARTDATVLRVTSIEGLLLVDTETQPPS
jgi:hypothetical protein